MRTIINFILSLVRKGMHYFDATLQALQRFVGVAREKIYLAGSAVGAAFWAAREWAKQPSSAFADLINDQNMVPYSIYEPMDNTQLGSFYKEQMPAPYTARVTIKIGEQENTNYRSYNIEITPETTLEELKEEAEETYGKDYQEEVNAEIESINEWIIGTLVEMGL